MAKKTFDFPVWLKGTPEEQQAESERQALTLASFTRAHLSDSERLVGRGKLLEDTARGNLEQVDSNETRILSENQLADALAMQGRYKDAATLHNDPERRKYFTEVVAALEMPDDEKCPCKDSKAKIGEQDIEITPRFERAQIFSPLHNKTVSLVECRKCGHLNARPVRSRLLKHNAAMAQNEAIAKTGNVRLISDAQVLKVDAAT